MDTETAKSVLRASTSEAKIKKAFRLDENGTLWMKRTPEAREFLSKVIRIHATKTSDKTDQVDNKTVNEAIDTLHWAVAGTSLSVSNADGSRVEEIEFGDILVTLLPLILSLFGINLPPGVMEMIMELLQLLFGGDLF